MEANPNDKKVADKMVAIMQKAGFTPEQMTKVLRMAKRQYLQMQLDKPQAKN